MSKKICEICGQKTDIYTSIHKKYPFVNGKNYSLVCFTCYFVPKIQDQKYTEDGSVKEEIELPYSPENLNSAKSLHEQGASESLGYAQRCVEAVRKLCQGAKSMKKSSRPAPSWNLC